MEGGLVMERHGATVGGKQSPEYRCYREMLRRCTDPRRPNYGRYGGRGIRVCRRWRRSFQAFLADVGVRPSPKHSLERKNNSRGYTPSNVVWATPQEQARNTRRNHYITLDGERQPLVVWTERLGLDYESVKQRLLLGWPAKRALTVPIRRFHRLTVHERQQIRRMYKHDGLTQYDLASRFGVDQSAISRAVNA